MAVDPNLVIQFSINGIVLGSLLALSAVGLTLVYGILNLSNFAHGDFITLGAYVAWYYNVVTHPEHMVLAAVLLALALMALAVVDRLRGRRLTRAEWVALLSAGGALLSIAVAQYVFRGVSADNPVAGFLLDELTLVALIGIVTVPLLAVGLDFAVWRPLRRKKATALTLIIVSIGVALVVRHLLIMVPAFGAGIHAFDRPVQSAVYLAPGIVITQDKILAVVISAILILGVHLLLAYTRVGKALRAMRDNVDLARVSGIDVDRMVLYVWILSGVLGAVAGVLLALINNVNPLLGWYILLPTFAAVVLGGIGSPYGAMAGALIIGLSMELSSLFEVEEYRLGIAFVILLGVLLVRPQGIFGGKR